MPITAQDRQKAHDKVRRLALKGDVRKALAALDEHLAKDKDDDRGLLLQADLRKRAGDDPGAAAAFTAAADLHLARGFALRAAACLRQALGLLPNDVALHERLADVNVQLGLPRDAADALERALALVPPEDGSRLVSLRRRVHELLPGDAGAAIRLADLLANGPRDEAVAILERAAAEHADPAHEEVWIRIQERLCHLEPENLPRAKELARRLVARGAPKRALALLRPCLAVEGGDLGALRLVARAFALLGQLQKAGEALREIARTHARAGRADEAKAAWQEILELLPGDPEAQQALLPPRGSTSLADELAEADFLAEEGLVQEALAVLRRLRDEFPGAKEIGERIEALDVELVHPDDLVAEDALVEEELPRDSTTSILERIPPSVVPRPAEAAGHRDLAVAFLEMEKYEEALAELERAVAADPPNEGNALSVAGRCHLLRGAPADAAAAYRRALASTSLTLEAAAATHFELAGALVATGDISGALSHYREALRLKPGYRDAEARILSLGGNVSSAALADGRARPPPPARPRPEA